MQLAVPTNGLKTRHKAGDEPAPATRPATSPAPPQGRRRARPAEPTDVELLTEIRDLLAGRNKAL